MKIVGAVYSNAPFESAHADGYLDFLSQARPMSGPQTEERWLSSILSAPGFPLAVAPMLAHLANLAYQNHPSANSQGTVCEEQLARDFGASSVQRFENKNAEGYGFVCEDIAFLIFCGTNDLSTDWVDNLLAIRKGHSFGDRQSKDIHMGFARHFELLRPAIEVWMQGLPAQVESYVCAGHSLGGSLAVLMAQYLGQLDKSVASVMTFGSPAVGGKEFSQDYLWHEQTWRVVDLGDPIPKSTPEYVGFRHVGNSVSSRAEVIKPLSKGALKAAPKEFAIFPKRRAGDKLGGAESGVPKGLAQKVLDLYRERPRHCRNVYRSSMQRMLESRFNDVPNEVFRAHYDFCGMPRVKLFRESQLLEVD